MIKGVVFLALFVFSLCLPHGVKVQTKERKRKISNKAKRMNLSLFDDTDKN